MIKLGNVSVFAIPHADKKQAIKVLEEAAEVYAEWQTWDRGEQVDPFKLKSECADLIQATCNLLAGMGVEDFTGFMEECKIRNEYRGRIFEETKKTFVQEIKEQMSNTIKDIDKAMRCLEYMKQSAISDIADMYGMSIDDDE